MKVRLLAAPWANAKLTDEADEAIKIIGDYVWKEASIQFYAERETKEKAGETAPKGMQRFINDVLMDRFTAKGWYNGRKGCFFKNGTWVRVTFRHEMSLGTDILDAIKVCKNEGMELAMILAANRDTLRLISPNDAGAMVSFEKLESEVMSLKGAIDIPLLIGELTPKTSASKEIDEGLRKHRPRDVSVPQSDD